MLTRALGVHPAKSCANSQEYQQPVRLHQRGFRNIWDGVEVVHDLERGRHGNSGTDTSQPVGGTGIADYAVEVTVSTKIRGLVVLWAQAV